MSLLQHCVALRHGQGASHQSSELVHSVASSRAPQWRMPFADMQKQQHMCRAIRKARCVRSEDQGLEAKRFETMCSVPGGNATFESGLVGLVAAVCAQLCLPMSSHAMWDGTVSD